MKPIKFDIVVPAGQKPWHVNVHPAVGKDIAGRALTNPDYSPRLRELFQALAANPKQFGKKRGKLRNARAADLKYRNVAYRAVFVLNEALRSVQVLALEPHDEAYTRAARRKR